MRLQMKYQSPLFLDRPYREHSQNVTIRDLVYNLSHLRELSVCDDLDVIDTIVDTVGCLDILTRQQRQAIVLHLVEHLTLTETGAIMHCSSSNVWLLVKRALIALDDYLRRR